MTRPPLIILAGGKGTRLKELTKNTPKPMVDVFGKPFLYWLIRHYRRQGFTDITVSTGYKAEVIEEYPWPWPVGFYRDSEYFVGNVDWYARKGLVIVNGDTWIKEPLPQTEGPWILSCGDVDAGAQCTGAGRIRIIKTRGFTDIGTPSGLARFKRVFKKSSHYIKKTSLD